MTPAFVRRLHAEWELLNDLAALNPERLTGLQADDTTFHAVLSLPENAPGTVLSWENKPPERRAHSFSVQYPVHFPAVPMELFLQTPVRHPNVHPGTGFVCLWDRHRVSNTVEHAVHKLAAMLDGALYNAKAVHVMQPEALLELQGSVGSAVPRPLRGICHQGHHLTAPPERRRRLQ